MGAEPTAVTAYRDLLPIALDAVDRAASFMQRQVPVASTSKGDRDLVSEIDYAIERDLRAFLRDATPGIAFLGEEEGVSGTGECQWTLDPVDGTVNFVRGLPLCGISLGLLHGVRPVLGVVDLPFLDARYWAAEGCGAFVNGQPIKARGTKRLSEAIVGMGDFATGSDAAHKNRTRLALMARLAETVQRVRMSGSAAVDLVWLAEGKIDAAITLSNHPWDMTAGVAIVREAGAVVLDTSGADYTADSLTTLAITPGLVGQMLPHLQVTGTTGTP
ncbi:inositol monophosphatase family protein [Micromonospora sp. WMMD1128]|uniref:inositol monophosphatase family protein n=1 Tax=Micromonospora sp. WMMD1128 TaxID=3015150 RepID=UPI00248C143E|nr:inositol monophosphatase family protein [Micromonospora sp. WMMD1128]WBB75271.1 inositol monophosphatase family protein [Micromonospora sp. WMMD1128]